VQVDTLGAVFRGT